MIQETEIFIQLKPKLKRQVLDKIFYQYYKMFDIIFDGCELNFKRKIIEKSKYNFYPGS